jgi:hypothetical protein
MAPAIATRTLALPLPGVQRLPRSRPSCLAPPILSAHRHGNESGPRSAGYVDPLMLTSPTPITHRFWFRSIYFREPS